MASSINASTTAGVVTTADTSAILQLQTGGTTAISISASQAVSFTNAPTVTGGTANGVAYLNGSKVLTTGSALVFDGTNLGVGVTPNAWSLIKGLQVTGGGFFGSYLNNSYMGANWYFDGTNKYIASDFATEYEQNDGKHIWYTAPSGTAGNAITFTQAMTLDASGNLIINDTSRIGSARLSMAVNASTENLFAFKTTTNGEISALRGLNSAGSEVVAINYDTTNSALLIRTGSTERARIDSSGNLLVGTTSANQNIRIGQKLGVVSTGSGTHGGVGISSYSGTSNTVAPVIDISRSRGTTDQSFTAVASGDLLGYIVFRGSDGTGFTDAAYIQGAVDGTVAANQVPARLMFSTANSAGTVTERARIDSSGNLLVGTTDANPNSGTGVKINAGTGARTSVVGAADTNANFALTVYATGPAAYRFQVGYGGTIYATSTSITAISDASLKTNVRDLETGLTEVMALQPRRFDWINGDASNVAGFIAQEVKQVLPDLVEDYQYSDEETKLGLKMGDILPTLVKAIQEQQALITQLQADVAALKGA